ncbi:MAG: response regulator transcription factor [Symploca sp. SIO2E9]|nr:response regulator transcription factor [Symploca sp. SIO2E9]
MNANQSLSILIVEDDPMMQIGLSRILSTKEITIAGQVEDGNLAVEIALKMKPDIVLMDIGLPGLDGIEATQRIKAALPEVRILILTYYVDEDKVLAAISSGADAYCVKGTSIAQLCAAITTVAEGSIYLDARIADYVVKNVVQKTQIPTKNDANNSEDFGFSEREIQVLRLLAEGKSNAQIGEALHLSPNTVKGHVRRILLKMSVSDRVKAAVKALKLGLV